MHRFALQLQLEASVATSVQSGQGNEASVQNAYGYRARKPSNYEEPVSPSSSPDSGRKDNRYISTPKIHPEQGDEPPHDYSDIDDDEDSCRDRHRETSSGYEYLDESFEKASMVSTEK